MNRFIVSICLLFAVCYAYPQQSLEQKIKPFTEGKKATIGVAVKYEGKDILTINGQRSFPMQSVFKFPLAMTVLDYMNRNMLPLETGIFVRESDLLPNTYSPLRDTYPQGNFNMSVGELIRYAVSQSDNNACDILFRYIGGTEVAERYIRSLGIDDISILVNEEEMHSDLKNQYLNQITPRSAVQLLDIFLKKDLFPKVYKDFLVNAMIETSTGPDKLKAQLPVDVVTGHKTGSSSRTESGIKISDNDMGFIRLPDGKQYTIAVFVADSAESDSTNAGIIADISKAVYEFIKEGA